MNGMLDAIDQLLLRGADIEVNDEVILQAPTTSSCS